ncbi:hypothetical protein ES332_D03G149900v1 [Gossypium tomentosum]|uniref:Uncharacterized protein n=1 Tax=Gossypium tomentosum TaxID=34277 RepID=A0A5D2LN79_GOSTO|nr:hypothetical protein ES332_D03G149900v1 [Gossypium tomentosum]
MSQLPLFSVIRIPFPSIFGDVRALRQRPDGRTWKQRGGCCNMGRARRWKFLERARRKSYLLLRVRACTLGPYWAECIRI